MDFEIDDEMNDDMQEANEGVIALCARRRDFALHAFHQLPKADQKKLLAKIRRSCIPGDEECWWNFHDEQRVRFSVETAEQLEGAMITAGFEPVDPTEYYWRFRMHRRSPLNVLMRSAAPPLYPPMQPKDETKEGSFYWWMMKYYIGTYTASGQLAEYMQNDLYWPRVNTKSKLKQYLTEVEYRCDLSWYLDCVWKDYEAWKKGALSESWFTENQRLHEEKYEPPYLGTLYFKGFDKYLRGDNDYQYEIGKEYMDAGPYYFAAKVSVCAGYYAVDEGRYCVVEPIGPVSAKHGDPIEGRGFYTAPGIRIVRELSRDDAVRMMMEEGYNGSQLLEQIHKVHNDTPYLKAMWKELRRRGFCR